MRDIMTCHETTDWLKLANFLNAYEKISLSGGGDPFCNYDQNIKWHDTLISIYPKKIDVHTALILPDRVLKNYNKVVLHMSYDRFKDLEFRKQIECIANPLRLVFVVTEDITTDRVQEIAQYSREIKCQLSFRELYFPNISNYKTENILKSEQLIRIIQDEQARFVEQKDYNIYYMPDNNVYKDYFAKELIQ